MSLPVDVADKSLQPAHIAGEDCGSVVEGVVQGDDRKIGIDQFLYQRVKVIGVDDGNAVQAPVARMLQIAGVRAPHIAADERDVVTEALGFLPEAVERGSEILVHETAVGQVREDDPDTVGAVGLQRAGSRIGSVAQLLGSLEYTLFRRFSDISPSVERIAVPGLTYA